MLRLVIACYIAKFVAYISRKFNIGAGATWSGELALRIFPPVISTLIKSIKKDIIIIAGTNGKTTTSKILVEVLKGKDGNLKIVTNETGANLINGIAAALILSTDWKANLSADYAIFEVDEGTLPLIFNHFIPQVIILLNLFRDQLDRYGEVGTIVFKWTQALIKLSKETNFVINADDPQLAYIGTQLKGRVRYFGIDKKEYLKNKLEHAVDSIYCPRCDKKLHFCGVTYSHLGKWSCENCKLCRLQTTPQSLIDSLDSFPLYNIYNFLAGFCAADILKIKKKYQLEAIRSFKPAFGRYEEVEYKNKKIKILLSKNPTGFNQAITTLKDIKHKTILLVLNDRIPDGRDVSWIWDVDFELIWQNTKQVICSGDRTEDMALRLLYTLEKRNKKQIILENDLKAAIQKGLDYIDKQKILYILPTYSAMLEVRKVVLGRKIL